jgi:acetyl-CoA C-acetyltransferase
MPHEASSPPPPRPLPPVYILGGYQTDFARNFTKEGKTLFDLMRETVGGTLAAAQLAPAEIEAAHVGNFIGELTSQQGHLGSFLIEAEPGLSGIAASRHEAACASGSIAALAALGDIQSGRYEIALTIGIELMRNKQTADAQTQLGVAALVPEETAGVQFPWPKLLSEVADEYGRRFGLDDAHLRAIARNNFACAARNPNAQARAWKLEDRRFSDDNERNPLVAGRLRRYDCCPVTDGGAGVVLASAAAAERYAQRHGLRLATLPRITGFGHRTARISLRHKLLENQSNPFLSPQVRATILDAFARAQLRGLEDLSAIECHDCFTMMEYMLLDHFGFGPPGWPCQAIEDGVFGWGGRLPVNPSGGLLGGGHPVGATGVRMLLDAAKQVSGRAGGYQVAGARRVATMNIGGSASTSVCFIVESAEPAVASDPKVIVSASATDLAAAGPSA